MDYISVANSSILYLLVSVVLISVVVVCLIFLRVSLKRAKELGIRREKINSVIKSSFVFSIAPSIPIVIALIAMIGVLGKPFSWLRLSIIGSFQYELMTANIGATSMGVSGLGASGYDSYVFANSMWIMSLGIIWGMILCIFFLGRFSNKLEQAKKKESQRTALIITSLYFGMLSVFIGPPIVKGGVEFYTLLISAAAFILLEQIRTRFKIKWLNDYVFTLSMITGMAFAVIIGV